VQYLIEIINHTCTVDWRTITTSNALDVKHRLISRSSPFSAHALVGPYFYYELRSASASTINWPWWSQNHRQFIGHLASATVVDCRPPSDCICIRRYRGGRGVQDGV